MGRIDLVKCPGGLVICKYIYCFTLPQRIGTVPLLLHIISCHIFHTYLLQIVSQISTKFATDTLHIIRDILYKIECHSYLYICDIMSILVYEEV